MTTHRAKRAADSQVELNQFMMPEHANFLNHVHGGVIMKLVDEAGALCSVRHARLPVVTVAIDSVTFHSPVHVGDVVNLKANLNYVGRTSMEVGIKVLAENPLTGEVTHTSSAYAVYVALDETGQPAEIPPLLIETPDEERRWQQAAARRARRLAQRDAD